MQLYTHRREPKINGTDQSLEKVEDLLVSFTSKRKTRTGQREKFGSTQISLNVNLQCETNFSGLTAEAALPPFSSVSPPYF